MRVVRKYSDAPQILQHNLEKNMLRSVVFLTTFKNSKTPFLTYFKKPSSTLVPLPSIIFETRNTAKELEVIQ